MLYRPDKDSLSIFNINHHGVNSIVALIELLLMKQSIIPVRS